MGKVAAGAGLLVRAVASQSGWGHPLPFAIISYCGYAISAACLGVAVVLLMRSLPHQVNVRPTRGLPPANRDRASDDGRIGGLVGQLAAQ